MKISIDPVVANYINAAHADKLNQKSVPFDEASKNFDQIMIHANSRELAESQIIEKSQKDVKAAVYQQIPEEKIAALKEQISQGMYKVDAEAVASRILLLKGEEF